MTHKVIVHTICGKFELEADNADAARLIADRVEARINAMASFETMGAGDGSVVVIPPTGQNATISFDKICFATAHIVAVELVEA